MHPKAAYGLRTRTPLRPCTALLAVNPGAAVHEKETPHPTNARAASWVSPVKASPVKFRFVVETSM